MKKLYDEYDDLSSDEINEKIANLTPALARLKDNLVKQQNDSENIRLGFAFENMQRNIKKIENALSYLEARRDGLPTSRPY